MMKAQIVLHTPALEPSTVNGVPVQRVNSHQRGVRVGVERIFCEHLVAPLSRYYQAVF